MNIFEHRGSVDELDGILYRDVKSILTDKIVIENILFTTQLIFLNNEEIVEFINKLMEYGYEDMALDYVENINNRLTMDFSNLKRFNENRTK